CCREEILCDIGVARFTAPLDAFDVDADLSVPRDGDEGYVARVSKVEVESAEVGVQLRFAERVVDEADLIGIGPQVSPQQLAQRPARDDETPLIALKTKPRAAIALVIREHRVKRLRSEEHTSELQSRSELVCGLLL